MTGKVREMANEKFWADLLDEVNGMTPSEFEAVADAADRTPDIAFAVAPRPIAQGDDNEADDGK